jgi:hypothetical protein
MLATNLLRGYLLQASAIDALKIYNVGVVSKRTVGGVEMVP